MKLPLYECVFVVTLAVCVGIYNVLFEDPWDIIDASDYRHLNLIPLRPPLPRSNNARKQATADKVNGNYDQNGGEKQKTRKQQDDTKRPEALHNKKASLKTKETKSSAAGSNKKSSPKVKEVTSSATKSKEKRAQKVKEILKSNLVERREAKFEATRTKKEAIPETNEPQNEGVERGTVKTDKTGGLAEQETPNHAASGDAKEASSRQRQRDAARVKTGAANQENARQLSMLPIIIGGCAGSGTRVFVELFRRLGVIVPGNSNMDSLIGLKMARTMLNNGLSPAINHVMAEIPGEIDPRKLDKYWTSLLEQFIAKAQTLPSGQGLMAGIKSGTKMWGFKDPENMLVLPFLAHRFPGASVIHVVRDGRDVASSTAPMHTQFLGYIGETKSTPLQRLSAWARMNMAAVDNMRRHAKGGDKAMRSWVVRLEDLFAKSMEDQASLCHAIQGALQPGGKLYYRSCADIYEITQRVVEKSLGSHTNTREDPARRVGKWRAHSHIFESSLLDRDSKKALTHFGYM